MARKKVKNYLKQKFNDRMKGKLVVLYGLIVLAFLVLLGRITYIDTVSGDTYKKIVLNQQQYNTRTIPFKRGDILDRNGTKLATSKKTYNVILDAKDLLNVDGTEEQKRFIKQTETVLKKCFGIAVSDVEKVLEENPSSQRNVLKVSASFEEAEAFNKMDDNDKKYPYLRGVYLEDNYVRTYPYDTLACDTIGFVVQGNVGNGGIESSYNSVLNGTDGREYGYLDEDSDVEKTIKEPENGSNVVTTIDLQVQTIVEKCIQEFNEEHKNKARKGEGSENTAAIVMNPQNGEIIAMASYPNFDLNNPRDLSAYFSDSELDKMSDDEKVDEMISLWSNYCVSGTYEPGSTFKPFTIAAALDDGTITGDENYDCQGYIHVGDYDIHCSHRDGHGIQTLKEALENSCNVALMRIGMDMGKEELCRYQSMFGFGQYTGIDLPSEPATSGLLYSVDNMDESSLATNAFGQNFEVTMVQLASGFCSLINGGNYYKPHIVKEIQDENGNVTETKDSVLVRKTISEESCEKVKDYMLGVVEEGTATECQIEGYDIGGKTGTAEKHPRGNGNYLVSFIGYAPQENPQYVVYVVIDEPNVEEQADSSLAVNLTRNIMQEIFPYLGVDKTSGTTTDATSEDTSEDTSGDTSEDTSENTTETETETTSE